MIMALDGSVRPWGNCVRKKGSPERRGIENHQKRWLLTTACACNFQLVNVGKAALGKK